MADKDLLQAIDPYIQAENTGTAMIIFTDNSLGRIYLNAGIPISARYRNKEGMDALEMCKSMDVQTVKFHKNTDIVRSRVLLQSNYEVIETLNQSEVIEPVVDSSTTISGNILTPANRQRLGSLLSEFIGPVAPLVMTDLPGTVDVETALSIVSREIDDTQRAAEFVATARQFLN